MFITAFTSARHLSLSWASSIQSILSYPPSWRSILLLSSTPRSSKLSLFLTFRQKKPLYRPHLSPIRATSPTHLILLHLITLTTPLAIMTLLKICLDIASSSCDALTWASSEYCRNSGSNAAEILSYKTHITASSLTVTGVYITLTERRSTLRRWQTRMRSVS